MFWNPYAMHKRVVYLRHSKSYSCYMNPKYVGPSWFPCCIRMVPSPKSSSSSRISCADILPIMRDSFRTNHRRCFTVAVPLVREMISPQTGTLKNTFPAGSDTSPLILQPPRVTRAHHGYVTDCFVVSECDKMGSKLLPDKPACLNRYSQGSSVHHPLPRHDLGQPTAHQVRGQMPA